MRSNMKIFALGGAEVLSFKALMQRTLEVSGRKRILLPIPFWAARIQSAVLGLLPNPVLTSDQVTLLESDNVVSDKAAKDGRTLEGIGIAPTGMAAILPSYLWRFRKSGQFQLGKVS